MNKKSSHVIFLALGSNLGDREANLQSACEALPPAVLLQAYSHIYETAPWGYTDQPYFLNQVVKGCTNLSPQMLLIHLKQIEIQMGREKTFRNGPRQIDIDILYYDSLVLETPSLTIPHVHIAGRGFVLVPLMDIAPNLHHPVYKRTTQEMLSQADTQGVKLYRKIRD